MDWMIEKFKEIKDDIEAGDTACALLILASALEEGLKLEVKAGETVGHEICMGIRHGLFVSGDQTDPIPVRLSATMPTTDNETELPKGFECRCGVYHRFPGYVYAHWRDELVFTCPECGRRSSIVCGHATPEEEEPES